MSASATSWSSTSTDETSTDETRATVIFVGDENHDVGAVAAVHQIANTAHANGLAVAHFVQHQGGIEYEASSRANSEIPQSPLMPGSRTRSPSATPVPQPNTLATPAPRARAPSVLAPRLPTPRRWARALRSVSAPWQSRASFPWLRRLRAPKRSGPLG